MEVNIIKDGLEFSTLKNPKFQIGIIGKINKPLSCRCKGELFAITIVFKPLGLNQFISCPFESISAYTFQQFNEWLPYSHILEPLLSTDQDEEIIEHLDQFLQNIYNPFTFPLLQKAMLLMDEDNDNLKEIESKTGINRKMLLRLFEKHLGISPTLYKRINRFRKVLEHQKLKEINLTQTAYETYFSDQSHFIKDIKKLSGEAPKRLLDEAIYICDSPFLMKLKKY